MEKPLFEYEQLTDIERCKELIKDKHKEWIGLSNQEAIKNVLKELEILKEHERQYMEGELFSAKQVKKFEKSINKYYIHKDKLKELEEYANWHIEHLTGDIEDYIDDSAEENAIFIGELKEEREHWRDILRIIKGEETYINYKEW